MLMSNGQLRVVSRGYQHFKRAIQIAFLDDEGKDKPQAVAIVVNKGCLIFLRYLPERPSAPVPELMRFPFKLDAEQAALFAWNWLQSPEARALLSSEPDIDGSVAPHGFRVEVADESWETAHEIVRVAPEWALYHK